MTVLAVGLMIISAYGLTIAVVTHRSGGIRLPRPHHPPGSEALYWFRACVYAGLGAVGAFLMALGLLED